MAMENIKLLIFAFSGVVALTVLVHAQSQSGFISIDCGLPDQSVYTDKKTGINYTSDKTFTEAGVSYNISPEYNSDTLEEPFLTVRSFPEGMRNCYNLKPAHGYDKFLIRASFMYGNYDGKNKLPRFDLLLGADVWDSVEFTSASAIVSKEIIHVPPKNFIYVCLGNKGSGTPFISSLELRPIANSSYPTNPGTSLLLYSRLDIGSKGNETYRFKDDVCDRIWSPYTRSNWLTYSSSQLFSGFVNQYQPPSVVMQTAAMPANGSNGLVYDWTPRDPTLKFLAYLYFAELDKNLTENQTREENMYCNGALLYKQITPFYLTPFIIYTSIDTAFMGEKLEITINKTEESSLPPILNALELYQQKEFLQSLTNQDDVDAIKNIKANYGVKRNWQGDPCAPKEYLWQGLNCSYPDYNSPRITCLNLSSSKISGEISPYIADLTLLQSLDLSNNNLTGLVPDFLLKLSFLTVLNLRGNKLQGSVPAQLREKGKNGLSLSLDGNRGLCSSTSCTKEKTIVVPVLAAFLAVLVFVVAAISILWIKARKQGSTWNNNNRSLEVNRRFSYADVVRITDNFKTIIGKGGFGTVYHGKLDNTQVAVKMLSLSSIQGDKEFQTEVELLLRVHHKNLTTLVGYCDDGTNMGLIYEFMANGNLESHLLGEGSSTTAILSWKERLQIATEAAQGLEYLHSGCKPPIVHRDVKPTNILLNENFQAKISDFGLSRIFPIEGGTHVSTTIVGTPGYLDPEYYTSNRLTEKSDVFSFGVVLLQMIASKPAMEKSKDRTHIIQWVSFMLAKGDIENVVDPRLQGDFNMNSVSKAVKLAMACVSQSSAERPTMNRVVIDLNESLAIEIAHTKVGNETESKNSNELISLDMSSELSLVAR